MHDNLNPGAPRDGSDGRRSSGQKRNRDREVRPVVEREVPLGQQVDRILSPAVHAWLDGELPEAAARSAGSPDVEFWRTLNEQMERTRRLRTPEHVEAQIMAALPPHAPAIITPWYQREFVITPAKAATTAAALVALTALVTAVLAG